MCLFSEGLSPCSLQEVPLVSQGVQPFLWEAKRHVVEFGHDQERVRVRGSSLGMVMAGVVARALGRPCTGSWSVKV